MDILFQFRLGQPGRGGLGSAGEDSARSSGSGKHDVDDFSAGCYWIVRTRATMQKGKDILAPYIVY